MFKQNTEETMELSQKNRVQIEESSISLPSSIPEKLIAHSFKAKTERLRWKKTQVQLMWNLMVSELVKRGKTNVYISLNWNLSSSVIRFLASFEKGGFKKAAAKAIRNGFCHFRYFQRFQGDSIPGQCILYNNTIDPPSSILIDDGKEIFANLQPKFEQFIKMVNECKETLKRKKEEIINEEKSQCASVAQPKSRRRQQSARLSLSVVLE